MSGRVVVVGSLNIDLVVRVDRLPQVGETLIGSDLERTPGGKGLNQAVAAARSGVAVAMVGCVGDDDHGRLLRAVVAEEGIGAEQLRVVPAPTGTALITVAPDGPNTIVVSPGANAATDPRLVAEVALTSADVVLVQAEVPEDAVVAAFSAARAVGARTVLNQAPFRPVGPDLWALVDVVVVNETELAAVLRAEGHGSLADDCERDPSSAPESARALLAAHPEVEAFVVTVGAGGAWVVPSDPLAWAVGRTPRSPVDAVDTVGAGDCLTGWLAGGLARGWSLTESLGFGVDAATLAVQRRGAVASMPTFDEVTWRP